VEICVLYFYTALNQLAGTGWLMGDGLKNFISRLLMLIRYLNFAGLEVFPSPGSTRRQVIHSLDFFVLLYCDRPPTVQDKRTRIIKASNWIYRSKMG
jgi:hypothetical protein